MMMSMMMMTMMMMIFIMVMTMMMMMMMMMMMTTGTKVLTIIFNISEHEYPRLLPLLVRYGRSSSKMLFQFVISLSDLATATAKFYTHSMEKI